MRALVFLLSTTAVCVPAHAQAPQKSGNGGQAAAKAEARAPDTAAAIGDLQVLLEPTRYETIPRSGGQPGGIDGWLVVIAVTNNTADWKPLVIPISRLGVTTPDRESHPITAQRALEVSNSLLSLQKVQSMKWEPVAAKTDGIMSSFDTLAMYFSPPGKNPAHDPHVARLFDNMKDGTWRLEVAPGQTFRVPLLFGCPKDSKPLEMSWPEVGSFGL